MPRTKKDFENRRQQILDGALTAFAEKGFEKTTNKDIAVAAGIKSPGLIYHYFQDKWDLFHQILAERVPVVHLLNQQEQLMDQPPREALTLIATTLLERMSNPQLIALMRLVMGEALRRPQIAEMVYRVIQGRMIHLVESYIQHQISLGNLRPTDTRAAALCFIGSIIIYVLGHDFFNLEALEEMAWQTMAETAVDIFLKGLEVETGQVS